MSDKRTKRTEFTTPRVKSLDPPYDSNVFSFIVMTVDLAKKTMCKHTCDHGENNQIVEKINKSCFTFRFLKTAPFHEKHVQSH